MRILLDARMMGAENTRGLGRYIHELLKSMLDIKPDYEWLVLARSPNHVLSQDPRLATIVADIPWYSLSEQLRLSAIIKSQKPDLVHFPHWNVPLTYNRPYVSTIHDLLLRHQPVSSKSSTKPWPIRAIKQVFFRLTVSHTVKAARSICVPTDFVSQDLRDLYPASKGKIVVTGEGITSLAKVAPADLGFPYLLYVGSAYPHKRLDLLLQAWPEIAGSHPGLNLVIAGESDVFMKKYEDLVLSAQIPGVTFLGRVGDNRLSALYRGAQALIYPSSFEGFGLTPLEALSVGCPVICSDIPACRDVLQNNGVIYFKSGSKADMILAIRKVVDNLQDFRDSAVLASSHLAERHSWQKAAESTLSAYNLALNNKKNQHGGKPRYT